MRESQGKWTRGAAHVMRHRIPEQLEALVDAYLELGDAGRQAVERLTPFLDRYGVPDHQARRPGGAQTISDVHHLYTLQAEVQTALAIVMGAARAVGDSDLVEICRQLQQKSSPRRDRLSATAA